MEGLEKTVVAPLGVDSLEAPRRRASMRRGALLAGLAGLLLFGALYASSPLLHDNDAAYHLQIARRYAGGDWSERLSSTRRSLLAESFGDKELLFHVLLIPFARGTPADAMAGGRVFLAILDALVLATLGALATRLIGRWGWLVPVGLVLFSVEFDWRLVRLRPELLSLILLLLAAVAAAARRPRTLGAIGFAYAFSYVAWHAFLGLCGIWFLLFGWLRREWNPLALLYPLVGVALGLLVHPQFPANLTVAWTVHVEFFRFKELLDVGTEIRPNSTEVALFANLGIWLGLALLWRSRVRDARATARDEGRAERAAITYGAATVVFGLLYLLMSRFSIYFLPFAVLSLLALVHARGERLSNRVALGPRRSYPLAAVLAVVGLVSLPALAREVRSYRAKTAAGPNGERLADREAFGRAVPSDAKVAAPWNPTSLYMLYAPQGRYLNCLDPVLMAAYDPASYAAQRAVFDGVAPDIPLTLARDLDSDFVAFPLAGAAPGLLARLGADPRVVERYRGFHALYEMRAGANSAFWLDWQIEPPGAAPPPAGTLPPAEWPRYPRLPSGQNGEIEGFVDLTRLEVQGCGRLVRGLSGDSPRSLELEFAPYGPGALWLDGKPLLATRGTTGAVLGEGVRVPIELTAGNHVLTVETCPAGAGGPVGFYLVERTPAG